MGVRVGEPSGLAGCDACAGTRWGIPGLWSLAASGEEAQQLPGVARCLAWVLAGGAAYGAALGLWRAPLQAAFVAAKLPALLIATAALNGLLNGLLAQALGARLSIGESLRAVLASFALFGAVLGALAPAAALFAVTLPGPEDPAAATTHGALLLSHVAIIAAAGVFASARLLGWLRRALASRGAAARVLIAWLAGNLLLGAQLSWILRPYFGTPSLPVRLLRERPLDGSFYEAVLTTAGRLLGC